MATSLDIYLYGKSQGFTSRTYIESVIGDYISTQNFETIIQNIVTQYISTQNFETIIQNIVNNMGVGSSLPFVTVTSNYTPSVEDDYSILVDASSGPVTITLPNPSSKPGKVFFVKKIDASTNSVTVASSQGIDSSASVSFSEPNQIIAVQSISTKWIILWR